MTTGLQLAVVVPTFNERANLPLLLERLKRTLSYLNWELVLVDDDSPDGTADAARKIARHDLRVRVVQRIGRRGLSSACIEGICATAAPLVAVMDGDLQHDETLLPRMVKELSDDPCLDIVIGSRFIAGGGIGEWSEDRIAKSAFATRLSKLVLRQKLQDPMSGFFMIRTMVARATIPRLSAVGFKILLDLVVASERPLKTVELPYVFRARSHGESKLDYVVALEFLIALYDRLLGRLIPVRFLLFSTIGIFGLSVHMTILVLLYAKAGRTFVFSETIATLGAMTINFLVNNTLTYRDKRLRGVVALWRGWLSFCTVCGIGAIANVGLATFLFSGNNKSWSSAALAGILISAVWNYALSSRFVWGRY